MVASAMAAAARLGTLVGPYQALCPRLTYPRWISCNSLSEEYLVWKFGICLAMWQLPKKGKQISVLTVLSVVEHLTTVKARPRG